MLYIRTIGLWILLLFIVNPLFSQMNFKVGVNTNYVLDKGYGDLLDAFNTENNALQRLEKEMPALNLVTGVVFGLRYAVDTWSVDLTYQNSRKTREAFGENTTGSLFEKKYYYSMNELIGSLEYKSNSIMSYGIGVGPRTMRIQRDIQNSNRRKTIVTQDGFQWNIKAYLLFEFGGKTFTRFALRPYFDFPLSSIALNNLRDDMELTTTQSFKDSFNGVGMSFIFYNGPK